MSFIVIILVFCCHRHCVFCSFFPPCICAHIEGARSLKYVIAPKLLILQGTPLSIVNFFQLLFFGFSLPVRIHGYFAADTASTVNVAHNIDLEALRYSPQAILV